MANRPPRDWDKAEKQFLRLLEQGHTMVAIARVMDCSPGTLTRHFGKFIAAFRSGTIAEMYTEEQRAQVQAMSGYALPQDQIAVVMGMSETTLIAHFAEELRQGIPLATTQVAAWLFAQCRAGDVQAMKFWLGCQAGWTPKVALQGKVSHDHHHEVTVKDPEVADALRTLDDDGRAGLRLALTQVGATSALSDDGPPEGETVH